MDHQWQNEMPNILDTECLFRPSHHRSIIQHRTSDILDLWSEQLPSEAREWAVRAATEVYSDERRASERE